MRMREVRLGDVLALDRVAVDVDPDAEYRQIGIRSFGNGIFHRDPCLGTELSKLRYFEVRPGRLILSNIMAWEGAIGVSTDSERGFVGSARFLSYQAVGDVDIRYLNYYFQTPEGRALIRSTSTGTVARNQTLSPSAFERATVPLPSRNEQCRVAEKLDASLARLSAVVDLRARILNLQSSLRESLVDAAISDDAPIVRVGNITTLARTEVEIEPDELYKAIGMRSFGKGIIRYAPTRGDKLSKLRYFSFPNDALALSNIKAWEGAISVTSEAEAGHVASNRFLFYRPVDDRANVSYLRHYFLSRPGLAQICAKSPGGADRNRTLGIKGFEAIELPLPSRCVQDRVATTLDALSVRIATAYEKRSLSALRPALLDAAFSGQL